MNVLHSHPARFSVGLIVCLAALSSMSSPTASFAAPKAIPSLSATKPAGANPYLAFLPAGAKPDYAAWNNWLSYVSEQKKRTETPLDPTKLIAAGEIEPNDSFGGAQFIAGFGTGAGDDPEADVSGVHDVAVPTPVGPFGEDDGSILLATPLAIASGSAVTFPGTIGDGPFGGTSGDFDFFELAGLSGGDEISVDMDTPFPFAALDPFVTVFNSAGTVLAFNDDAGGTLDSFLNFAVPSPGTYYVAIGSFGNSSPADPFDSSTGNGSGGTGTYDATIGINAFNRDFYSFDLEAGDIIAAAVDGSSGIALYGPGGSVRQASSANLSSLNPGPFPAGGDGIAHVAEVAGTWVIQPLSAGVGSYTLNLRAFRPPFEEKVGGSVQTLFIDFDGETFDASVVGGLSPATLSPLSSFLGAWGLLPSDEDAVIDAILAQIEEDLSDDMRVLALNGDFDVTGIPGDFDIVLLNSRDHADPFGSTNVSRVIIGGTISELGVSTIGIAESIDVGNFAAEETGVVLLDLLSAPAPDPNSLNSIPLDPSVTIIDLIAAGVGNIAAHEAGHFLSSWHTDNGNLTPNIMDRGGDLLNSVGVGLDGIFGTGDDADVDFGADEYTPVEAFEGTEDTLNATAFGLSTGADSCDATPEVGCRVAGASLVLVKDKTPDKSDLLLFKWLKGEETLIADLGDPLVSSDYRLCVYDSTGLIREAQAPAGGTCAGKACWKTLGSPLAPKGFKYKDKDTTAGGTLTVTMKAGTAGKPKIIWKAKGENLTDGALSPVGTVTAQILNEETGVCFTQDFSVASAIKNQPDQFKAKAP